MKYYSPLTKGFYDPLIHGKNIPGDSIELSDERHQELLQLQSSGKEIIFNGSEVIAADHVFTDSELHEIEVSKAQKYLRDTDFYFTVDKYAQLTEERKAELLAAREEAREIIRKYVN